MNITNKIVRGKTLSLQFHFSNIVVKFEVFQILKPAQIRAEKRRVEQEEFQNLQYTDQELNIPKFLQLLESEKIFFT